MSAVQIGRIIPGGKVHMETYRTGIADNHLRNITIHAENLAAIDPARLCKRCFTESRIRAAISVALGGRGTGALLAFLNRALDAVKPAAVLAEDNAELAAMAETVAQAPAVMALPIDERPAARQERRDQRPRNLAELAAAMRATHPHLPRPRRTRRTPIAA